MIAAGHSGPLYPNGGDRAERAPDYRAALTVVRMTVWFFPLGRT
jgi:hypothetical protein